MINIKVNSRFNNHEATSRNEGIIRTPENINLWGHQALNENIREKLRVESSNIQEKQVQCSNGPPVLRLTSQTSQK